MSPDGKKKYTVKRIAVVTLLIVLFNPLSLWIYLLTTVSYVELRKAKPQLETKFQALRIPEECYLVEKKISGGGINNSPNMDVTYKCDSTAQQVYDKLAIVYKPTQENIRTGPYSLESRPIGNNFATSFSSGSSVNNYIFSLTPTQNTKSGIPDFAVPSTNPVYLEVAIFRN